MLGLTAQIALDGASFAFDKLYTYIIPTQLQPMAKLGCRVIVPFGMGNTRRQGMIFRIEEQDVKGLKSIIAITDKEPVLSVEGLSLCEYMKENVFCTYYDAVHSMLPTGLNYKLINYYSINENFTSENLLNDTEKSVYDFLKEKGEQNQDNIISKLSVTEQLLACMADKESLIINRDAKRKVNDATQKWVRISASLEDLESIKLTPRQRELAEITADNGGISVKELCYYTGATVSVVNKLIEKGVFTVFEKQIYRSVKDKTEAVEKTKIILTDEQQSAFDGLINQYRNGEGSSALLYGVTGSGKTQVFLKLVDEVAADGKGVIVMVPEISLTPQMIDIFKARYGDKIAVFHSAMSMGKRLDEWQRIKNGNALIAIGTRSAVFAPFSNLGLIIIDEEQEHTYKSEMAPRFHTRDIARWRTAYNKGLLCLASATPSIESFTYAKKGKHTLYKLTKRYGGATLPQVETVDMKKEILEGNASSISRTLYEGIEETLKNQKQVILLLNRRGHNTYVSCPDCGNVATCPNCSVSLTYHSANKRLICHYCGYSASAESKCTQCGGENMKFMGIGTQKIEEEIKSLFPNARVIRVDADSTLARDSYAEYLDAFAKGEYDILLGTQMVAKGLDFPNVTLVGVLGADSAMYSEDFRSFERTFSLLTQVVGRAGRGDFEGKAIVQTLNPDSNIIELAARQDYENFYEEEILTRKLMTYPPYCDICTVTTVSADKNEAERVIEGIFGKIKEMIKDKYPGVKLIILGPAAASIPRVNNKYRFRMIIKCRNNRDFRDMLKNALEVKTPSNVSVLVDINPETII